MSKKIIISSCLLGENVKYNGGNNSILKHPFIQKLKSLNFLIPICPEVDGGLPIPRTRVEIKNFKAISEDGFDKTKEFALGANKALDLALKNNVKMAIMKSKSPSCGKDYIYDGSFSKKLIKNNGISVSLLKKSNIKIFTENELEIAFKFWKNL